MPNNVEMEEMTDTEIIRLLGGVTAVARMLNIKPPSVHGWLDDGIPEGRLRELAGQIEIKSHGRFSRQERWPDKYDFYWPELAQSPVNIAQAATETVAIAQGV
jgi:DNA-binding transcriptional regulator YdaS (Cro superfamily)